MVRVAGLKRRIADRHRRARAASRALPPRQRARDDPDDGAARAHGRGTPACFRDAGAAGARRRGHRRCCAGTSSTPASSERLQQATSGPQIFPVLTPLAVDPAHPFPYISGLSLNLAVVVRQPGDRHGALRPGQGPADAAPVHRVDASGRRGPDATRPRGPAFVPLEDVIAAHLDQLFPGMEVARAPRVPGHPQRGRRGRGGRRREPAAGDGAGAAAPPLRPAGAARGRTRTIDAARARAAGARARASTDAEVYAAARTAGPHRALGADRRPGPARPASTRAFVPRDPPPARRGRRRRRATDIFAAIRDRDVLLHHPYDSFATTRAALPRAGRRRPERAGDQADAVPDLAATRRSSTR